MRLSMIIVIALTFAGSAHGETAVAPHEAISLALFGGGTSNYPGLVVTNYSEPTGYGTYSNKRAVMLWNISELPRDFESCRLELYVPGTDSADRIDVCLVPWTNVDWQGKWDFDFSRPLCMSEPLAIHGEGLYTVDVTECMRGMVASGESELFIRLSMTAFLGGPNTKVTFAALGAGVPGTGPRLVFSEAVPSEKTSIGTVKGLFR